MITYNELLSTPEYWITRIQLDLYAVMERYMQNNHLSRSDLARELGVTKGYISQVLNGDFDHRLSKLVKLSLAVGMVPQISYIPLDKVFSDSNTVASEMSIVEKKDTPISAQMNTFPKSSEPVFSKMETSFPLMTNPSLTGAA